MSVFEIIGGKKLKGKWSLIRMGKPSDKNNWLLIKAKDQYAQTDYDITQEDLKTHLGNSRPSIIF